MDSHLRSRRFQGCESIGISDVTVVTDIDECDSWSDMDELHGIESPSSENLTSQARLNHDQPLDQQSAEGAEVDSTCNQEIVSFADNDTPMLTPYASRSQRHGRERAKELPENATLDLQSEDAFLNSSCLPLGFDATATSTASCEASYVKAQSNSQAQRARFFVFVKILFRCLEEADDPVLRNRAKGIVLECTRRNRMGDPHYTPLVEAVERRLKQCVGEVHWKRATLLLRHFAARQVQNRGRSNPH